MEARSTRVLNFGAFYALVYWGLLETPAGLTMIILATVPLLTLILAVLHRLERFSVQSAIGSLVALGGMAIVFSDQRRAAALVALGNSPGCRRQCRGECRREAATAEPSRCQQRSGDGNRFCTFCLAFQLVAGEAVTLPTTPTSFAATAYLVLFGSVALFMLFLFVIERWTASATSYVLLLMPLVTVLAAAVFLGEQIRPAAIAGGALVIAGVYVGTFAGKLTSLAPAIIPPPSRDTGRGAGGEPLS